MSQSHSLQKLCEIEDEASRVTYVQAWLGQQLVNPLRSDDIQSVLGNLPQKARPGIAAEWVRRYFNNSYEHDGFDGRWDESSTEMTERLQLDRHNWQIAQLAKLFSCLPKEEHAGFCNDLLSSDSSFYVSTSLREHIQNHLKTHIFSLAMAHKKESVSAFVNARSHATTFQPAATTNQGASTAQAKLGFGKTRG